MADFNSIIIDHLNLGVHDLDRSFAFYKAALAPLGIADHFHIEAERAESRTRMVGFGREPGRPILWLIDKQIVGQHTHVAFTARTRRQVDEFHAAGLAAGGTDHGAPGIRFYHPDYYGAFVLDPDGINLEVVCHHPA